MLVFYNSGGELRIPTSLACKYRIRQNSRGGKLLQFLLNRESFPVEYIFTRLGIHYYKKILPRKFSHQMSIFVLTVKVFPLDCFVVYGNTYI